MNVTDCEKKLDELSFEEAMGLLENAIRGLERGDLGLEGSLEMFERGIELSNILKVKLQGAEQKISQLLRVDQELVEKPMEMAQENEK